GDPGVPQLVPERLYKLGVGNRERTRPLLHQDHADPERRKHASVFYADHSSTHADQGLGNVGRLQDLVAVDDRAAVDGDFRRGRRLGPGRNDDDARLAVRHSARAVDTEVGGIHKTGASREDFDAVASQLGERHISLGLYDVLDAEGKVRHRDLFFNPVTYSINA